MTNANSDPAASSGASFGASGLLRHLLDHARARRVAAAERARIRGELASYSDRELAGFGLFRADIEAVACGRTRH
ncbi:hypothetical protein [Lichenicoccus sp.]|uniref:hypothetical protein n=1 Tax=Lichenicoccus sp. TaxID=2781899 RepID=UPI003D107E92